MLLFRRAFYGRMRVGKCVTDHYGNVGCSTDVTSRLNVLCGGRKSCEMPVIGLHAFKTCPKDFTSHLEVLYRCLPGECLWHLCYTVSLSACSFDCCSLQLFLWLLFVLNVVFECDCCFVSVLSFFLVLFVFIITFLFLSFMNFSFCATC